MDLRTQRRIIHRIKYRRLVIFHKYRLYDAKKGKTDEKNKGQNQAGKKADEKCTVIGRVLKKSSKLLDYQGKSGKMQYFNIIIGTSSNESLQIRNYQRHKFQMIREGLTYKFTNVVKKGDALWVVQTSSVSIVPPISCNVSAPPLPEDDPPAGLKRTIHEALGSPAKSTVRAKIVKVSPVSMKCSGSLPVRCLGIKDHSGCSKVALFDMLAQQDFVEGSAVELSGLYKKTWNNKDQLVASKLTHCQFLRTAEVDINVTEEDAKMFSQDQDFGGCPAAAQSEQLTVTGITDVAVYLACDYEGCHKKKMGNGVCPTCSGTTGKQSCRVKIEIKKDSNESFESVIFEKDVRLLFGDMNFNDMKDDVEFMVFLAHKLPVQFSAIVKDIEDLK